MVSSLQSFQHAVKYRQSMSLKRIPWRALTLRFTAPVFHRIVIVCARLSQTPLMRSRTTAHGSHWSMCPVATLAHVWSAIDQRTEATSCTTSLRSQLWVSARSAGYEWHDTVSAVNIPPQGRLIYREYPNVAHCGLYCNRTPFIYRAPLLHPSPHAPPTPHPMPHLLPSANSEHLNFEASSLYDPSLYPTRKCTGNDTWKFCDLILCTPDCTVDDVSYSFSVECPVQGYPHKFRSVY